MTGTEARSPPTTDRRGRDYLSYSAVTLWQQCPLRFYFRYVRGLPEETVGVSLVFGAAMHAAVQHHFEALLASNKAPSIDCLVEIFWNDWHLHDYQEILFGRSENIDTISHLAERMLRAFQTSAFANPEGTIIGVEEEVRGPLIPGLPDLLGRVDLVVETEHAMVVSDFKTARSAWCEEHVVESAGQLWLYSELVQKLATGKPTRLQFAVLTKTKAPELVLHEVPLDGLQVERTKRIVERVWNAIQGGHYYPAPSPIHCPTCPYREPCRSWTG